IENSMLGAAHAGANPLTAHFGIVHGHAVGIMLPHVVRFNAAQPGAQEAYLDLAASAGLVDAGASPSEAVEALVVCLKELLEVSELADPLPDELSPERIQLLAEGAAAQWTAGFNPRDTSAGHFETLYRAALTDPGRGAARLKDRAVAAT